MKLNREKALKKLPEMSWEDLDWLERQCARLKESANGIRFFDSRNGSHREATAQLGRFFDQAWIH